LYSIKDRAWKLADFGIATADVNPVTVYARGTQGYRAPELLRGAAYSNKVDIWALGCILHELAVARKVFPDDETARSYRSSESPLEIQYDKLWGKEAKTSITECVHDMLQTEPWSRPSASLLLEKFRTFAKRAADKISATQVNRVQPNTSSLSGIVFAYFLI
jgi:serine/threonine protein kinase